MRKAERRCFARDERGIVTIEWIMIAAVVLIASISICVVVMTGASNMGSSIAGSMNATVATP